MVSPQLLDYIRQQLASSVAQADITTTLVGQGWALADVNDAFAQVTAASTTSMTAAQAPIESPIQHVRSGGNKVVWLTAIATLLLLGAGGAYAAYRYGLFASPVTSISPPVESAPPVATSTNQGITAYSNSVLGYRLSIQRGWHISEEMSKKFDNFIFTSNLYKSAGCDLSTFADMGGDTAVVNQKLQDCLKKSPKLAEINAQFETFNKGWNIGNSQTIILTRLTSDEESKADKEIASMNPNWPQGSFIRIAPFDFKGDFDTATSSSKTGLKRSFYNIGTDIKSYLTDLRDTKISGGGLSVMVPITSQKQVYSGGQVQSIGFFSTATKDSQDEKDFFSTIQSFSLSN